MNTWLMEAQLFLMDVELCSTTRGLDAKYNFVEWSPFMEAVYSGGLGLPQKSFNPFG